MEWLLGVILVQCAMAVPYLECDRGPNSCGVLNPPNKYQRYRANDYHDPKAPFFQWYYFYVQDRNAPGTHSIAISLGVSKGETNENIGTYVTVSNVPSTLASPTDVVEKFYIAERFPLEAWSAEQNSSTQDLRVQIAVNGTVAFSLVIDETSDTITSHGTLNHAENRWYVSGAADNSTQVSWNVTLQRVYGWFGQDWFEDIDRLIQRGVIQWNTYSHCARITGSITTKSGSQNPVTLLQNNDPMSTRFRAYGDMNWGLQFPVPKPGVNDSRKYNWGWYYAGNASANQDDELSFIAGVGEEFAGAPMETMIGRFADFRFSAKEHVEMIVAGVWEGGPVPVNLEGTNDGKLLRFDVIRTNWTTFTDAYGQAEIPLRQTVIAETSGGHLVVMDFFSTLANYNRLLFPTKGFVFSDFEGLGVETIVTVSRDNGKTNTTFTVHTGGIEFGYRVA